MPSPQGPLLPRRRLGAELRRLRDGRTLEQVAADTLISTSKLSRLENGQGVPQLRDVRDLIDYYGADRATSDRLRRWTNEGRKQAWWKEYSDVIRESYDVLLDYEAGASLTRIYTPMTLPGLLQTRAYAMQLLSSLYPQRSPGEIAKLVEVRLRRQETVLDDLDETSRLEAIIDEAAVRRARAMTPDDDARDQLRRLRDVSQRRNVSIRILPLAAGLHAGLMGRFAIYQFSDDIDRDVVHIETHSGDRYLEEQSSVLEYLRLFDAISRSALDDAEARDLLARLIDASPEQWR